MPSIPPNVPDVFGDQRREGPSCKTTACSYQGLCLSLTLRGKRKCGTGNMTNNLLRDKWVHLPWAPLLGRVPPNGILLFPQRWLPLKSLLAFMATFFFVLMPGECGEMEPNAFLICCNVTSQSDNLNLICWNRTLFPAMEIKTFCLKWKKVLPGKYLDCFK